MQISKPKIIPKELKYKNEVATKVDSFTLEALIVTAKKANKTRTSIVREAIYELLKIREGQLC